MRVRCLVSMGIEADMRSGGRYATIFWDLAIYGISKPLMQSDDDETWGNVSAVVFNGEAIGGMAREVKGRRRGKKLCW